ncbi:MAG: mechanosensitive ion channel family protein [Candidatus Dadabacteria bacterium]|nr:MAG: mechanosensitive ion channel family protein [Candidatus Dadabacteria bacterium]
MGHVRRAEQCRPAGQTGCDPPLCRRHRRQSQRTVSASTLAPLTAWLPSLIAAVAGFGALALLTWLLLRRKAVVGRQTRVWRHLTLALATIAVIVAVIATLPIEDTVRAQLLSFLGLLISGVIGLSSTSFVGNAMAGLMLRALNNIRPGDFVRVGEHFGKVSEFGLLHTELQSEERTLITMPNLHLVTNPVEVVRSSGTVVTATVSLGYDVSRQTATEALLDAARAAQLEEPFVHVLELGDFSVTYRISGLLPNVRYLITARSALREAMLDGLHKAGIEIASPTLMNQRQYPPQWRFVPHASTSTAPEPEQPRAENIVFDKAEAAETAERIRERLDELEQEIEAAHHDKDEERAARLEQARTHLRDKLNELES